MEGLGHRSSFDVSMLFLQRGGIKPLKTSDSPKSQSIISGATSPSSFHFTLKLLPHSLLCTYHFVIELYCLYNVWDELTAKSETMAQIVLSPRQHSINKEIPDVSYTIHLSWCIIKSNSVPNSPLLVTTCLLVFCHFTAY